MLDLAPDKFKIPYTDLKCKINRFLYKKKCQQRWKSQWTLPDQSNFGKIKIQNGTSYNNPITNLSLKTSTLFYTRTRKTTTMFNMSNMLHCLTRSQRMWNIYSLQNFNINNTKDQFKNVSIMAFYHCWEKQHHNQNITVNKINAIRSNLLNTTIDNVEIFN